MLQAERQIKFFGGAILLRELQQLHHFEWMVKQTINVSGIWNTGRGMAGTIVVEY
jgi:hypothetical protein